MRVRGQKHVIDLTSEEPLAIYIDAPYLSDPATSVPMLAANFGLYDKYFVHSCELEFVPNQPVTVGGTIGMAPDYDPLDPMPASKSELSSTYQYVSGAITQPLRCKMPNIKGPDGSFLRPALYSSPVSDSRLNSYGSFKIFGEGTGLTKGDSIGRLILHYDISFFLPEPQHADFGGSLDSVVVSLKSIGTSTFHRCSDLTSTTNSDVLQFTNAADGAVSSIPDYLYSAIVDSTNALMPMVTATGRLIYEGTRIFFRCAQQSIATTTMSDLTSSTIVGALNLARNLSKGSEIILGLSNTEKIGIRNVRRWNAMA